MGTQFLFSFVDFGNGFKIFDKDGIDPTPLLIDHISKSNPGVVTLNKDKNRHNIFKTPPIDS